MKIALLGGTGDIGAGLAIRLALLGHEIIVGSRKVEKAKSKCDEYAEIVKSRKENCKFCGMSNEDAADEAEVAFLTIPWKYVFSTIEGLKEHLKGKIVVSPVVPMDKVGKCFLYVPPETGSAAEQVADILKDSRVVAAFQTVPAAKFSDINATFDWDVPVCSDDDEAKKVVMDLVNQIEGLRALDAGPLSVSRMVESITPLLVNLMIRNKMKNLSVKFS